MTLLFLEDQWLCVLISKFTKQEISITCSVCSSEKYNSYFLRLGPYFPATISCSVSYCWKFFYENSDETPCVFSKLLRPEYVKRYLSKTNQIPLSSDALSGFGTFDNKSKSFNLEIRNATTNLMFKVIPKFARKFADVATMEKKNKFFVYNSKELAKAPAFRSM